MRQSVTIQKIAQVLVYKHFGALLKLIVMKKWAMSELLKTALVPVYKHLGTIVKLIVTNVWAMSELLKSAPVLVYKKLGIILKHIVINVQQGLFSKPTRKTRNISP